MGLNLLLLVSSLALLATSKLVYLAELFRHGARYTTANVYDANETKHMSGNLTAVGMRQQYLLGSYLRKDYLEALGLHSSFDANEVEVFVDGGSQRCVESAHAHMAGWFPLG
jgi:acid phosphatase